MKKVKRVKFWTIIIPFLIILLIGFLVLKFHRRVEQFPQPQTVQNIPTLNETINQLLTQYTYIKLDNRQLTIKGEVENEKYTKFETSNFSVLYPNSRKSYGENSFNLCEEYGQCQDSEMYIEYENNSNLTDWLLTDKYINGETITQVTPDLQQIYNLKVFPNIHWKQYDGVGVQIVRLVTSGPLEKTLASDLELVVAFQTEKGVIYGNVDLNNQIHKNIWSSLILK